MVLTKEEVEFHRKTAAACFNRTWDYLDMKKRDSRAAEEMLYLAHTSRYHWGVLKRPRQEAVGDWQLGRVYAAIGNSELSLQYALSCLRTCEKKHLDDLLPSAMEGVARAYAVAGDLPNAAKLHKMARQKLGRLKLEAEDRTNYASHIRETQRLIGRR